MVVQNIPLAIYEQKSKELKILTSINFTCKNSTDCCKKNTIPVIEEEVTKILNAGYALDQFLEELSPILVPDKMDKALIKVYILKKKPFSDECVFLDNSLCKIHTIKPFACKIYPFDYEYKDGKLLLKVHPKNVCKQVKLENNKQIEEQMQKIAVEIIDYLTNITH